MDGIHGRHIDHQTIIANGVAGDIVPAAANGDGEPMRPRMVYRCDDVGSIAASGNQGRPPIDQPVPNHSSSVISRSSGLEQLATQYTAEHIMGHVETSSWLKRA
ncbi:UNVERIFIED_ORG: hypothetical protein J2W85_001438 [Ensifer adhaerens]|nr:hypothetical protein [Ensifer adhaerens]